MAKTEKLSKAKGNKRTKPIPRAEVEAANQIRETGICLLHRRQSNGELKLGHLQLGLR